MTTTLRSVSPRQVANLPSVPSPVQSPRTAFTRTPFSNPACQPGAPRPARDPALVEAAVSTSSAALAVRVAESTTAGTSAPAVSSQRAGAAGELGMTVWHDQYVLGRCVGHGSFGKVYLAKSKATGEEVAVKVLHKGEAVPFWVRGASREKRERNLRNLKREVAALQAVQSCSNAITLKGTFESRTEVFIVMEACAGGDLETLLTEQGPLSERQTALVLQQVLTLVAACHDANLYHGDIKPANFLFKDKLEDALAAMDGGQLTNDQAWLKAVDFGCAQNASGHLALSRKTGTPMFMAPEIFSGSYGKEADMWSVGMLMYLCMAGRFPFWETVHDLNTTTLEGLIAVVSDGDIPLDYGVWLQSSPEALQLLEGLLERDPAKRLSAQQALAHPWFAQQMAAAPAAAAPAPAASASAVAESITAPATAPSNPVKQSAFAAHKAAALPPRPRGAARAKPALALERAMSRQLSEQVSARLSGELGRMLALEVAAQQRTSPLKKGIESRLAAVQEVAAEVSTPFLRGVSACLDDMQRAVSGTLTAEAARAAVSELQSALSLTRKVSGTLSAFCNKELRAAADLGRKVSADLGLARYRSSEHDDIPGWNGGFCF